MEPETKQKAESANSESEGEGEEVKGERCSESESGHGLAGRPWLPSKGPGV